jgi:hypothetical protein
MENFVVGYPFVSHVDQSALPRIEDVKDFLAKQYSGSYSTFYMSGCYKSLGYLYDFRPFLKRFVYKQYGTWSEAYAPNKTALRRVVHGKIDEIFEVPNKK